ncbi:MAG: Mrp/NBP35 family ATP-binding protein [Acidimicrobiales bacterium]
MTDTAAPVTPDAVTAILRNVIDPELGSDIVELGMAKGVTIDDGVVTVTIALTTMGCPLRAEIRKEVRTRVGELDGVADVKIDWTELSQEEKSQVMDRARRNIAREAPDTEISLMTRVLLIASGKGGVGKSSVTVNLAAALAARGFTVGVLDADIWGFSVPRMIGVDGRLAGVDGEKKIRPNERRIGDGLLKVVSMGFLVENEEQALMWRGLILNRAVRHFLEDVRWGEMDYLLVDMPPGTGDVQMGIAKLLPRAEMIVVTTPALSAQKVAVRVANMGRANYLRVIGVIENMTAFVNEEGNVYELFGSGGGEHLSEDLKVPLLGRIPIDGAVSHGGDSGNPVALGDGPAAVELRAIADRLADDVAPPIDMAGCSARIMEATDEVVNRLRSGDPGESESGVTIG